MSPTESLYYRNFADGPIPKNPWALILLFVRKRLRGRALWLMFIAAMSMATMALEAPALRGFVEELHVVAGSGTWTPAVLFWLAALGGAWITSSIFNRLYQLSDIRFSPPLRYMIQAYLF